MTELPENCTQADFVVHGPWVAEMESYRYRTRHLRVVRRVFSNGSSILELQEDWSDAGSCAEQFRRVENEATALQLALERLASDEEKAPK